VTATGHCRTNTAKAHAASPATGGETRPRVSYATRPAQLVRTVSGSRIRAQLSLCAAEQITSDSAISGEIPWLPPPLRPALARHPGVSPHLRLAQNSDSYPSAAPKLEDAVDALSGILQAN